MIEVQAICYILNTGSINGFNKEWFVDYREHFDYIYSFVQRYGRVPDKLTFVDKFKEFKCFEVSDPLQSLVDRLKEQALYKRIIPVYNKAYDLIVANKANEACNLLVEQISKYTRELTNGLPPVDLSDPEIKKGLYRQLKADTKKFSTGRPELDGQFGGWNSRDYVVIFARLGIGKSWIAEFFAYNLVKSGVRVGYYSGEMSPVEVSLRLDTFNTNLSNNRMFNGDFDDLEYDGVADSFGELPGKFYVLTPGELGNGATIDDLKRFVENQKLGALFVDQISLMKRDPKLSSTEAIAKLSNDLRILQATLNIPFFIVSQQNRAAVKDEGVKDKDDLMATIAYSDTLGQNATLAFSLDYNSESRILTLNLAKSRRSKPGKFQYNWDIDKGSLRYIPMTESDDEDPDDTDYGDEEGDNPF